MTAAVSAAPASQSSYRRRGRGRARTMRTPWAIAMLSCTAPRSSRALVSPISGMLDHQRKRPLRQIFSDGTLCWPSGAIQNERWRAEERGGRLGLGKPGQEIFQTDFFHHVVGHAQLGGEAGERLGGVQSHLRVDAAGTGGGIELAALGIGNDDQAAV